jgi:hypothetical protein
MLARSRHGLPARTRLIRRSVTADRS